MYTVYGSSKKLKETDKALDMLYSIDDAGIAKPLTIQQREALTKRFQRFPVIRYRLDYLSFSTQGNNDVKYKIEFTPRSDSDTQVVVWGSCSTP